MRESRATADTWFVCMRPNPQAQLRLFCFPYSGGNPSAFASWRRDLPPTIEIWAAQLPGRGARMAEAPFTSMAPLVKALAAAILPLLDVPFVFFGHSMGALLSFELARTLHLMRGPRPLHLVASGHRAPQIPDRESPIYVLPEAEFIEQIRQFNGTPPEVLEHAELREIFLPILRADFTICETYAYADSEPLDVPISAYGGLRDRDVTQDDLRAWREQTTTGFSLRMFPGDHFFPNTDQHLLLTALSHDLGYLLPRIACAI